MKTSEQINELAAALATVQGQMRPAQMNAVNPFLKNKYADLNSVIESVKVLLAENGLSYVQMPNTPPVEYGVAIGLTTRLMHTSGQWLEDTFVMPMPTEERGKSMMQVAGSAISYARRYALSAMLGIVADEDSDGNGHSDPRGRNVTKNPPKAQPAPAANGNDSKPAAKKQTTSSGIDWKSRAMGKTFPAFASCIVNMGIGYNSESHVENALGVLGEEFNQHDTDRLWDALIAHKQAA